MGSHGREYPDLNPTCWIDGGGGCPSFMGWGGGVGWGW